MKEVSYNDKISLFERLKDYQSAVRDSQSEDEK